MRGIDKKIDVSKLSKNDVISWLLESHDDGLNDLGKELQNKWSLSSETAIIDADDMPVNDLLTVLLLTSNLIEFDAETRKFKRFRRGSNATIAHVLFGSKENTGGSYNKQIQVIKRYIAKMWSNFATTELLQTESELIA